MDHILCLIYSRLYKYIIKKNEAVTDNPPTRVCANKIGDRITFKLETGYYLELLMPETMKLLETNRTKTAKDENREIIPDLEITEVVLVNCNIVNNDYQHDSRVLYTLVLNKSFGQSLDISPKNFTFSKVFDSKLSYIEIWFTDQNLNL